MTDVILATEDLTILGGPESISVDLDFGPTGARGSLIFLSDGKPNDVGIGNNTPNIFDLCINTNTSSDEYLFLYQRKKIAGQDTWDKSLKLIPNTHSANRAVTFTDGEVTINIPVINIVPQSLLTSVTSANFNVQYSISGETDPISSSLSVLPIVASGLNAQLVLPIKIKAIKYSLGSWSNVTSGTVHLLITLTTVV